MVQSLLCVCPADIESQFSAPGQEWKEPNPEQHVLRKGMGKSAEGRHVLHVRGVEANWRFHFFPKALIDDIVQRKLSDEKNGAFKDFVKDDDVRRNFYFLLPDLLGLFLSNLGIPPPQATLQNFYIPILALYGRWTGVMLEGNSTALSKEQVEEYEADPDFPDVEAVVLPGNQKSQQPNMYQITWTTPEDGTGEPHLFSLGASIGGYYGCLSTRYFGGLVRKARWDVCDRDKKLENIVATFKWPKSMIVKEKTIKWEWEKDKGSIEKYRYGNCAETYTFLHMLS